MKPITVKMPDALKVRLEAAAARRGVSVGWLVREAAETYLAKEPTKSKLSIYERTKDLCGCLKTGISDLGSNPKHMEGFGLDSMGDSRYRPARRLPKSR